MRENNSNIGDYSLPFLMMIAKNMQEHNFNNVDIGYILVALFHASGQEAELITDSNLANEVSVKMNIGQDLFKSVAECGSNQDPKRLHYITELLTIFNQAENNHK